MTAPGSTEHIDDDPVAGTSRARASWGPVRRARRRWIVGLSVVAAVAILAAVGTIGVRLLTGSPVVSLPGDVAVADCVTVADLGGRIISVDGTSCIAEEGVSFYVASLSGACSSLEQLYVDVPDGGRLCLTPNLRAGRCYLVPSPDPAPESLERKGCSTVAGSDGTPILDVVRRVDGVAQTDCAVGAQLVGFTVPRPIAYCVRPTAPLDG